MELDNTWTMGYEDLPALGDRQRETFCQVESPSKVTRLGYFSLLLEAHYDFFEKMK